MTTPTLASTPMPTALLVSGERPAPTLNERQAARAVCRMCGQGFAITSTYGNRAKCQPCADYMTRLAGGAA